MLVELAVADLGVLADLASGRALAAVGTSAPVLVVTDLPQVAGARLWDDGERLVELPPMLSGRPGSRAARGHAEEPLAVARRGSG
jgi:hypothetical protein